MSLLFFVLIAVVLLTMLGLGIRYFNPPATVKHFNPVEKVGHNPMNRTELATLKDRPDTPVGFGKNHCWLAIRSEDTQKIAQKLSLKRVVPCSWTFGIESWRDHDVLLGRIDHDQERFTFVTPPVNGWSFVDMGGDFDGARLKPILMELGKVFPDVQAFGNTPSVGYVMFMRVQKGKPMRAFEHSWGEGTTYIDEGRQTQAERALKFLSGQQIASLHQAGDDYDDRYDELAKDFTFPDDCSIYDLAGAWSLDPSKLEEMGCAPNLGIIGITRKEDWTFVKGGDQLDR